MHTVTTRHEPSTTKKAEERIGTRKTLPRRAPHGASTPPAPRQPSSTASSSPPCSFPPPPTLGDPTPGLWRAGHEGGREPALGDLRVTAPRRPLCRIHRSLAPAPGRAEPFYAFLPGLRQMSQPSAPRPARRGAPECVGKADAGPRSPQHPGPAPSLKTQPGGGGLGVPVLARSLTRARRLLRRRACGTVSARQRAAGCGRQESVGSSAAEVATADCARLPPVRGGPGGGGALAAPLIHVAGAG
ncbi:Hypothetical predicted protein [Marmota monax]|uniref:Uncharacterized protein n=1 Tax=Marmota monax TaxID=9995 RepID=A0A5E4A4S5_MARMO|nr:hypothetical protein GHT09_015813 [Marmota monax]VTJ52283.1 Hypothetical predicted protein [Marmota monax]